MAEYIHSQQERRAAAAVSTVIQVDLPVNPLSHVYLTHRMQQDLANTQATWGNVLGLMTRVEVLWRGSAVFSLSGVDLAAYNTFCHNVEPWRQNVSGVDNEEVSITHVIPFGRKLFDPLECFPKTIRGELQLQITYAAAFTNFDSVDRTIESVELPQATPRNYLKVTTLAVTPTAAGEVDIELPIGNPIVYVLFFGTTKPAADTATVTLQRGQLLVDNVQRYFSNVDYETWRNLFSHRSRPATAHQGHIHQIDGAAFAQYMDTSSVKYVEDENVLHMGWDFSPLGDDTYLLQTAGKSQVIARITAGDANAIRVLPVELIRV